MKRFYLIICFLMSIIGSAWGQETYSVIAESTITPGEEFQATASVNLTYGVENASGWMIETRTPENGDAYGTIWATAERSAQLENNIPTSGTFVKIRPSATGKITYNVFVNTKTTKSVNVVDGAGKNITSFQGSGEQKIAGQVEFDVIKDGTYYIYMSGSGSLRLGGFTFTPSAGDDTDDPVATSVSTFNISDFNYVTNKNANAGLDRSLCGFTFEFSGGDALKCNATDKLTFRTRNTTQNGSVAISTTNEAKIMGAEFTCTSGVIDGETKYFTITDGDVNDLTSNATVDNGVVKLSLTTGVSKIVFAKKNVANNDKDTDDSHTNGREFNLSEIKLVTDTEMPTDMVTPLLSFASAEITTTVGGEVSNALTTTPNNFAVTYSITEDSNSIISEIAATGEVTLNTDATGTATITANFVGNNYYNAASSSYTLSVIEPKTTLNIVDFNYNAGTSVFNGLDRTGVDGFDVTFTGDASAPKFNSYELGLAIGNGGTMTVKAVDEGNTIGYIDFTKAESGNISNSGIDTNVEGTWSEVDGAVRFTPTTPNQIIIFTGNGNDFAIAAMTICTSAVPANVGSKQTPTITLASDALTAEIGTNATVNSPAVTTVPQNFKVRYEIDEDNNNTGSTIDENTGVVTIGNTPGTITVQAYFSGERFDGTNSDNNLFKAATPASYTLTITEVTPGTTTFNVSDFNYAGQSSSKEQNLDRTIGGFSFTYTGGEAIKYNGDDNFFFRGNNAGTLTIAPTDANNKITQIVIGSTTDVSAVNGFTVTADGNTIEPVLANGSITIDVPAGASSVVISTNELSATVNISSYTISTTAQPSEELCQPVFEFEHASLTVAKTGDVANALTTTPKNYPLAYNSSNTDVATVDAKTGAVTPGAAGTTTITVSSTATEYFNAANASYTLTVVDDESVAGKTWDFTTWSTADITTVDGDDSTWEYNNNDYYKNKTGEGTKTDFGLAVMEGLLFTTTGSDQIRIYPNTDGQTDGSIRLQSKNAKIYMPELKAGQTITLTMMTASESSARGMVFSGTGADKVQLIYGAETSKTMNVVTYRVTEDISAEELIMSASTGGLYLYSINLGYSELYWTDGSNTVTDVAVTTSGETSYTLNSATGASYTITDANGNESTDVEVVNDKVKVNTFTLGKTHTITATVDGHSATLTLRMVNTASISYEQTTATGTLGFSFVEPVLTKNPEGLNVVKWKSSNPEVATVVAETGEVTLVSAGEAIITAYIEANNYYAYTDASYTLTVNEAEGVQEPWTLSLVVADGESVAVGSTGHKLTMTEDGTIKAGQVTTAIPGLTLSFGKTGDSDWTVGTPGSGYTTDIVAQGAAATVDEETNYPTGGTYLGLEPTVNGVLSLDASYFASQNVVLVDKSTQTVVASYSAQTDEFADKEFSVPLQADHTYYLYNAGNGKSDEENLNDALQIHAITFTPVFLDRIGHVIVKNNEYIINGAQLADDIHDYPTFSNVHAEEGGSVHYHSYQDDGKTENTTIYLDEDGNLVIDGEGTAILEAHVSHTNTSGDACHSVAKCTVTYTKSQLKFSGTDYTLASNLVESFTEPTLTLPAALSSSTVTYSVDNDFGIDSNTGNITSISGSGKTATVTATISPENIYFNPTATYTITSATQQVPFEVLEEITVPVGTRAFSLIREDENGVLIDATGNVVIDLDDNLYGNGDGDQNTWGKLSDMSTSAGSYATVVQKFFNKGSIISADPGVVKINNRMQIDAVAEGTATVSMQSNQCTDGSSTYGSRDITIKINVVKDTESDYYESIYIGTGSTYRTWNFHNGFDATELSSYDNGYTALGNSTGEAENFITHIPSGHDFWIYDSENNTLKSNISITVTDNKIDRESIAFIANEPMNNLSLTSTATNCFASSKGTIDVFRASKPTSTYDYESTDSLDDKNVLTFYTFRKAENEWEGTKRNEVSDITFNAQTNMCGITGVDKDEHVTPYRSIQLSGKSAFIRVNDIKPGMWMSVIADNNLKEGVGSVQLASDGAEVQALGQSLYSSYSDSKDENLTKYPYNRVTNVFPYLQSAGTTVAIENESAPSITNIMVGYPAGMGTLNVGGGEKSPKINNIQRTYGYATFVSPYNIDLTGQTALKAYICDYYGKDNNLVHMVQIKHIPANTPVMLKGYARDMYVLYISEGNKPVEHGISEEVFAKNRLVGAMEDGMVQPTEEGLHNGAVTTWHNMGLTQNKFLTFTVASPIAKGRAYLRITQEEYEDLYAAHVSASAASTSTKIVFEDTDFDYSSDVTTPTGIENLENVTVTVGDGHYYNLNGVRVNGIPTQKGIYIRNGKKIVVR